MINTNTINNILKSISDFINIVSDSFFSLYRYYDINNILTNIKKYIILKYNDKTLIYNKEDYNIIYLNKLLNIIDPHKIYNHNIFELIIFNNIKKYKYNIYYIKDNYNSFITKLIQNENKYILYINGKIKNKKININNLFIINYIYNNPNNDRYKSITNLKTNYKKIIHYNKYNNYIDNYIDNYIENYIEHYFINDKGVNKHLIIHKIFIIKYYLNKMYIRDVLNFSNNPNIKYIHNNKIYLLI